MTRQSRDNGSLRWESYFLARGDGFQALWRELARSEGRRVLLIGGAGFDPRASNAASSIIECGVPFGECILISSDAGSGAASGSFEEAANENVERLRSLVGTDSLSVTRIELRTPEGRSIGGRRIAESFSDAKRFMPFTDVVVDITALPRGLYFPLIGTLLTLWLSPENALGNLHVVVCENPGVDKKIVDEGGDKAEWLHGFAGGLSNVSSPDVPRIWAPVLGEGQRSKLTKITDFVKPKEICPILPFPAQNPRRCDDLVGEYRELLFESWEVEPRDILFAAESNPFDVYRRLCHLDQRYRSALRRLGGAKTVVSAHSSKLLSLGVLLAAFERRLGVPHVQPTGYMLPDSLGDDDRNGELFDVWLAGEPYAD